MKRKANQCYIVLILSMLHCLADLGICLTSQCSSTRPYGAEMPYSQEKLQQPSTKRHLYLKPTQLGR